MYPLFLLVLCYTENVMIYNKEIEMRYDFETISDRNEMGSRKWAVRSEQFPNMKKDVVPFSVADMEFKNAPEIMT